jgi:excisionase family DNA binding protein
MGSAATSMTRLLTLVEVSVALRVSLRTVNRLAETGQLRLTKIGRRSLVSEAELEAYLAAAYRR